MKPADQFLSKAKSLLARTKMAHKRDATDFVIVEANRLFGLPETEVVDRLFDTKPANWWTLERCQEDARKYRSREAWRRESRGAYNKAFDSGWIDLCMPVQSRDARSIEACIENARQYASCAAWKAAKYHLFLFAREKGVLDECRRHMVWTFEKCSEDFYQFKNKLAWKNSGSIGYREAKAMKWIKEIVSNRAARDAELAKCVSDCSFDECLAAALEYTHISKWKDGDKRTFTAAKANGWLDRCSKHMVKRAPRKVHIKWPVGYWTLERCKEAASKFTRQADWKRAGFGFAVARKNGWMDECCAHMEVERREQLPMGYWTLERCMEEARKFNATYEWKLKGGGSFFAAERKGWLDVCRAHMSPILRPKGYWTRELCIKDARQYQTRTEWSKSSPTACDTARKNGWMDDCTAHMPKRAKYRKRAS